MTGILSYLEAANCAEKDSLVEHANIVNYLDEIDALYRIFVTGPLYETNPVTGVLAQSSHSAFLAASGAALRGQFAPTFMVARGCLESALYAYIASQSETDATIWMKRGENVEAAKRAFRAGRAIEMLRHKDPNLYDILREGYQWTIEFGGHPNIRSISESISFSEQGGDDGYYVVNVAYIHSSDALAVVRAIIAVAETACTALAVISHAMPKNPRSEEAFKATWDVFGRLQKHLADEGYLTPPE